MLLNVLDLIQFRNLAQTSLTFHPQANLIWGDNGQGKTNLLEAITLTTGQASFRAQRNEEMIAFGEQAAKVRGQVTSRGMDYRVEIELNPHGRRVIVDGKPRRAHAIEGLGVVVFSPLDLQIPQGTPSIRRRLLDQTMEVVWPRHSILRQDYQRTLKQRNRVLKERPTDQHTLLDTYDEQLAILGARFAAARIRFLQAIDQDLKQAYRDMSDGKETMGCQYVTRSGETLEEQVIEALTEHLRAALSASRDKDIARAVTSAGPHTDDLLLTINDKPVREYGSQGQMRSIVLAWRLAQMKNYLKTFGDFPLLVLDDVSSELDARRNEKLFDFIRETECQLFLSTPREQLIPLGKNNQTFQIVNGVIRQ